jgi:5-methylcytosine-specific restriction endonuclease McrBC GTP-binding regulatory subunit McrB
MLDQLEIFDLNEHHHETFDYDDVHDLDKRILAKDSRPLAGSFFMPNEPSSFEIILTPNDFDVEIELAWEVLKTQLILNKKA